MYINNNKQEVSKMEIIDFKAYTTNDGDFRGDIDCLKNGKYISYSFCVYGGSLNWEYKGWAYSRAINSNEKKMIEAFIISKASKAA